MQDILQKKLDELVEIGQELGTQFCAYQNGELIVNIVSGTISKGGEPVSEDTLFPVFSVTKGFVAGAAHLLAERGLLDYDMKICKIWPEFAVNGKEDATIRHALCHLTGIPHVPSDLTPKDIEDWSVVCAKVANLTAKYPPGKIYEYHPITFGWIVGEILRKLDGRPIEKIICDELCTPLGIRDVYIGLPKENTSKIATIYEPNYNGEPTDGDVAPFMNPLGRWMNTTRGRCACVPGAGGIMNAKSIARYYAGLLPGGISGIELLPKSRIKTATDFFTGDDESGMAMGFCFNRLHQRQRDGLPNYGHEGYGGALGMAFPEERLAVGFTKNYFTWTDTASVLIEELYDSVNKFHIAIP